MKIHKNIREIALSSIRIIFVVDIRTPTFSFCTPKIAFANHENQHTRKRCCRFVNPESTKNNPAHENELKNISQSTRRWIDTCICIVIYTDRRTRKSVAPPHRRHRPAYRRLSKTNSNILKIKILRRFGVIGTNDNLAPRERNTWYFTKHTTVDRYLYVHLYRDPHRQTNPPVLPHRRRRPSCRR